MGLNNEQLQAVNSNSDRILCLAGAGSGKTHSMVERISRLVKDGVKPSSILVLTFTNAAAAEMKERYKNKHLGDEIPEFRTFHAFCYSILCKDSSIRAALGYERTPGIASDDQLKDIDERAKAQCKITLSQNQLDNRGGLTKKELFQAELYDKATNRLMKAENLITFDKLNTETADLFASDHKATKFYKDKYCYIFVDEFQDTDYHQIKFLNSFPNSNFFFVGDTLQNLYRFRGTSNEYIKALSNAPDWEKIKLFTNYRSTKQICDYANKFSAKYADSSYRVEMQGTREGAKVRTKLVDGPKGYSPIDSRDISDVLKELATLEGTSAILCRTNREVSAVVSYLRSNGIEYSTNKDNKTQHLIDCAISDTYMLGWLASYLPSSKYGEYIRLSAQIDNPDLEWFLGLYGKMQQIREDAKIIAELKAIADSPEFTNTKLVQAMKVLGTRSVIHADKEYSGVEFLKFLKESISDVTTSELYVGTIHSVKGLEYDNVFVMNVGSYNFKLNNEDEKNLFYVAVTRAKEHLFVYELFN